MGEINVSDIGKMNSDNSKRQRQQRAGKQNTATVGVRSEEWTMQVTTVREQLARAREGCVTKWLIDGIIVEGGATLIHAQYGHGKSLVTADLAIAAAEGRPWMGAYPIAQQPVLYVDEDGNNDSEMNSRLSAFGANETSPLYFQLHQGFKIVNNQHRKAMIAWCAARDVRLVIFDSLVRLHSLSESSADAMKMVNAAVKDFTLAGITVVILHHSNRRGGLRGSSEIGAGYDCIYKMEKLDEGMFRMVNEKARSVAANGVWPGCTISVSTHAETQKLVLDGSLPLELEEEDTSAVLTPVEKIERKKEAMREKVSQLLTETEEMTESTIGKALGNSSRDTDLFKKLLVEMEFEGIISFEKRGKGRFYRLADSDVDEENEEDE